MNWKKNHIYQALKGIIVDQFVPNDLGSNLINQVCIDSRKVVKNDCFIALKGIHFDGHNFAKQAIANGAVIAIVEKKLDLAIEQIIVTDSLKAYGQIAHYWKKCFDIKTIAITGSNGKTTTKNILAQILAKKAPTLSTFENHNNEIGVPETLLNIQDKHQFAVIEMGATKQNDISTLSQLVCPDIAIVTSINEAHLKSFKTIEAIWQTKAEIYQFLDACKVGIVNLDDDYANLFIEKIKQTGAKVIVFSSKQLDADIAASSVEIHPEYCKFKLKYGKNICTIETRALLGEHNLSNILAASAACYCLGIPLQTVKSGIESAKAAAHRLQVVGSNDLIYLIDDTYNANPAAMKQAIDLLSLYNKPRIAIIGDMSELAEKSDYYHLALGQWLAKSDIDIILLFGKQTALTQKKCPKAKYFSDIFHLIDYLKIILSNSKEQYSILVKGSRVMQMERVVDFIEQNYL